MQRECKKHGLTEFSVYPSRKGKEGKGGKCKKCEVERVTEHRRRTKIRLVEMLGGKCSVCGYDKSVAALQFHHVDPITKEFKISVGGNVRSFDKLVAEAKKCVLMCANCHAELHWSLV